MSILVQAACASEEWSVDVEDISDGGRYIVLRVGQAMVMLPGFEQECVTAARQMAAAFTRAADELDLPRRPVAVRDAAPSTDGL
mgnify:FL=1